MMHFKDQTGDIHGFESDGSQDYLIQPGMVPLTELELDKLFNPTKYMTPEELKVNRVLYLAPLSKSNFKKMIIKNWLQSMVFNRFFPFFYTNRFFFFRIILHFPKMKCF